MKGWRARLRSVHSWAGLLLGGLLFAVFWMGSLSVIDRELDRWMMPATRLPAPPAAPPLDGLQPLVQSLVPAGARHWRIDWATPRTPVLRLSWQARDGARGQVLVDPAQGRVLPDPGTLGASGFIFPFHYGLHLDWNDLGKWLVGLAGMGMLVLLVSGVVVHRKLLADFFTFRPHKRLPRSSLDLHNVTGVAALPFHFAITLSGLVIFWPLYFPQAHVGVYSGPLAKAQVQADGYGRFQRPRAGLSTAPAAPLDGMVEQARRMWGPGAEPYFVRVWNPGDRQATVELRRSYAREVTMNLDQLFFDAGTGRLLHRFEAAPAMGVQRFIAGMHFVQFQHGLLRTMYCVLGLCGCVLIATGLVHWLAVRQARGAAVRHGLAQATTVASTAGLIVATLSFLLANRLLPADGSGLARGPDRAGCEVVVFFASWAACLLQALATPARAWRQQALAIAWMALACVVLNASTTDAYVGQGVQTPAAVWLVDGLLLALAAAGGTAARLLGQPPAAHRRQQPVVRPP